MSNAKTVNAKTVNAAKAAKVSPAQLLENIYTAGFNVSGAIFDAIAAINAIGSTQEHVREMFIAGYMANKLKYSKEAAIKAQGNIAITKANMDKCLGKDGYMTMDETRESTNGRKAWERILKVAGLKTTSKQGGARERSEGALDNDALELPKKVKVETNVDLGAFMLANADALYNFLLKNKDRPALKTQFGAELMGVTCDYLNAIKDVCAAHVKK